MPAIINFKICDNSDECGGLTVCPTKAITWDNVKKTLIIDELPLEVLNGLKSKKINLETLYNPTTTPAVNPTGELRSNVIKETV